MTTISSNEFLLVLSLPSLSLLPRQPLGNTHLEDLIHLKVLNDLVEPDLRYAIFISASGRLIHPIFELSYCLFLHNIRRYHYRIKYLPTLLQVIAL